MNGIANGGGGGVGAMVGVPAPAAHQTELVYIYSMVEQLSEQLAENKRALEDVVTSVGRARTRARSRSLNNEELLSEAAEELSSQEANIDTTISILSELYERAKYSREEYRGLLAQYATAIARMLKEFHEYKIRHVTDVSAWHRSYRSQLADARAENSRLREQIWEMQRHAGQANTNLRQFRTKYDEDEKRWERAVDMKAIRQELRFWKRMAMPEMADDDEFWSDDDDLVDPVEKERLRELEKRAAQNQGGGMGGGMSGESDDDGSSDDELPPGAHLQSQLHGGGPVGGVPMQRDEPAGVAIPIMPPRPSPAVNASANSAG